MNHSYSDKCLRFTGKIYITPRCHLFRHLGNWAYKNIRISFRQSSFMLEVWGPPLYCQLGIPELLKRIRNAGLEGLKLRSSIVLQALLAFSRNFFYFFFQNMFRTNFSCFELLKKTLKWLTRDLIRILISDFCCNFKFWCWKTIIKNTKFFHILVCAKTIKSETPRCIK